MSLRPSMVLAPVLAFWFGIIAAGCGSPASEDSAPPPPPAPGAMNFINAVPDAAGLDFYLDDAKLVTALAYRKSSGTLAALSGLHKLEVRAAGADAAATPLLTSRVYLQESQKLLVVAIGRQSDGDGAAQLGLVVEPFGIASPKELRLRLLHASPNTPNLDVKQDKGVLWSGARFGHFSPTFSIPTALSAELKLTVAKTGSMAAMAQLALKGDYAMGAVYTLIALGELDPLSDETTFFGFSIFDEQSGTLSDLPLTLSDSGPMSALYVFHAASDAQAIDIYAENGARLVGGLSYDNASPLIELPPGVYKLTLRAAGTSTVLGNVTLKLVPDSRWAVYLAGLRTSTVPGRKLALYAAPMERKGAGKSWRIIHAVPDAAAFELLNNGPTLFSSVDYPHAAPYRQDPLPSGTLQLRLKSDATKSWNIAIPQAIADSVRDEVTTLYLTGSSTNPAQPLLAVALVESSASAMRAPTLMPLSTTK